MKTERFVGQVFGKYCFFLEPFVDAAAVSVLLHTSPERNQAYHHSHLLKRDFVATGCPWLNRCDNKHVWAASNTMRNDRNYVR